MWSNGMRDLIMCYNIFIEFFLETKPHLYKKEKKSDQTMW